LSGTVRLDAPYAIAVAGARLVSDQGGTFVQAAGTVLSNNGGNVVANQGGRAIDPAAGSLGAPAVPWRLLEVGDVLAIGEILPAAGVTIQARALATGEVLALGAGEDGADVYALETDATGGFNLYVTPPAGGMVLEARLQDQHKVLVRDPGLIYDVYPRREPAPGQAAIIDEDTAAASALVQQATFGIVRDALADAPDGLHRRGPQADGTPLAAMSRAAVAAGLTTAPEAVREAVARRCAEAMVAATDPWSVRLLTPRDTPADQRELAMEALVALLRRAREASTVKLRQDASFFERWPNIQAINAAKGPDEPRWVIRKPADLNRFVLEEYVVPYKVADQVAENYRALGLPGSDILLLGAVVNAFILAMTMELFTNADGAMDTQLAIIEGWRTVTVR
jgi:hypothetical protein